MRSRNGNRPFLFTGIALISTLSFGADHYYIGYRLSLQNTRPVHENFSVAKAMQPCSGSSFSEITFERTPDEPLRSTLQREQALFLDYALSDTARIKSDAVFSGSLPRTCDTLTLPTRCYAVEFNDRFVTIFSLQ